MVSEIYSPPRKFTRKLIRRWERTIPLWQQKIGLLLHNRPIDKTHVVQVDTKNDVVILSLYDLDVVAIDEEEQYALKSFFSTHLQQIDRARTDLVCQDYAQLDGVYNETPSCALMETMAKLHHGVLFKFVISQNATSLINQRIQEAKLKNRHHFTFFFETDKDDPKSGAESDFLSDQYFSILLPTSSPNKTFGSPDHYMNRLGAISKVMAAENADSVLPYRLLSASSSGPSASAQTDEGFLSNKFGELIGFLMEQLNEIDEFIKDDIRIKEEAWKGHSIQEERKKVVLGIKEIIEQFMLPSVDQKVFNELQALRKAVDNLAQDALGFLIGEKHITQLVNFFFFASDALIAILEFVNNGINSIKERTNALYTNDVADILDTGIAYLCGFVNGLIDAIEGLIGLALLLLKIVDFVIRNWTYETRSYIAEVIDEISQSVSLDNTPEYLGEMWHVIEKGFDKFTDMGADLIEYMMENTHHLGNPRIVGYNLGYVVYEVVENYVPPLKISKVLGKSSKALKPILKLVN